jgi:hypothetical protein
MFRLTLYKYLAISRAEVLLSLPLLAGAAAIVDAKLLQLSLILCFIIFGITVTSCYVLTKVSWKIVKQLWN